MNNDKKPDHKITQSLMESANKVTNVDAMPISETGNPLTIASSDQLGGQMYQGMMWKERFRRKFQDWYNQNVAPWQDQYPAP